MLRATLNNLPRVAVVTGSAQGIGRSIALKLASDGLDVALNDLPAQIGKLQSLQDEIKDLGRKCTIVTGDVSQEPEVKNLVHQVAVELGAVDVVSIVEVIFCYRLMSLF
jgi:NAD(P)-dependent dehydrogenase (short-subunit alcohol dehydrogenase family)